MKKGLIIFAVVVIVLVALGFYQYQNLEKTNGQQFNLSTLTTTFNSADTGSDMQQVQALLSVLGQVSVLAQLDTAIFTHPAYQTLRDFSITLFPAENIGRPNPFLDIGQAPVETQDTSNSTSPGDVQNPDTSLNDALTAGTDSTQQNTDPGLETGTDPFTSDANALFEQLYVDDGTSDPSSGQ